MAYRFKFRVWNSRTECWLHGFKEYGGCSLFGETILFGKWLSGVTLDEHSNLIIEQCTGLEDKNGKPIYEGDIVQFGVFAMNDYSKFGDEPWKHLPDGVMENDITSVRVISPVVYNFTELLLIEARITRNPDIEGVEIIGNIHENPELLEA